MRYFAVGQEIEIEIGHSIDLGLLLMSKVTVGHEDESETGHSMDLGSMLLSQVAVGREDESEIGHSIDLGLSLMSLVTAGDEIEKRDRAQHRPGVIVNVLGRGGSRDQRRGWIAILAQTHRKSFLKKGPYPDGG